MQTQELLIGIGIIAIVGLSLYKAYMKIKPELDAALADGELSLDELVGMEVVDDLKDMVESLPSMSEMKKMKKADLIALAEKNGVDTQKGAATKATLIANLLDME
jgi:hypothetical protein